MSEFRLSIRRCRARAPWGMLFRNSYVRQQVSGLANTLRACGPIFEVTIEWGSYTNKRMTTAGCWHWPRKLIPRMEIIEQARVGARHNCG